jgi:hypothetical protein
MPWEVEALAVPNLTVSAGEPGIDTSGPGALVIGDNNATTVELIGATFSTNFVTIGGVSVGGSGLFVTAGEIGLDTGGAGTLSLGGANATLVDVDPSLSLTKDLRRSFQTPSEAVLVSGIDATAGEIVEVTLSAARLVGAPLNPFTGQRLQFALIQSGAGAFAVTWNAVFKVTWSDVGNATPKRSTIAFQYDGTNWNQDGAQTPYV